MASMPRIGKAYTWIVPGVGRLTTYPAVTARRLHAGFEQVTLRVSLELLSHIARSSKGDPFEAKRVLADIYPLAPPVDARDIVAPLIDPERELIQYSIKRGHYLIAEFFREHDDPCLTVEHLTCSCHPGERFPIYSSALPSYAIESDIDDSTTLHSIMMDDYSHAMRGAERAS